VTAPTTPEDPPPAPGYWKASDGNWYPPGAASAPGAPGGQKKGGCLKIGLIVLGILTVLGIIGVVALVAAGNKVADELDEAVEAENAPVDTARPDAQSEDQQVALGQSVRLSGYTTTVTSASFQPQVSSFETAGYLVADATIENRDNSAQHYNYFDFKLQTPSGQVIDPTFSTMDGLLQSGDLVEGGRVSGKIVWEVGDAKGDFFVIYKPDAFDAARGIWKVTI
jgi:hypothetical protein